MQACIQGGFLSEITGKNYIMYTIIALSKFFNSTACIIRRTVVNKYELNIMYVFCLYAFNYAGCFFIKYGNSVFFIIAGNDKG